MKKLSETEFEIMKILWEENKPVTSNDILDKLKGTIDWKLASLMTALARMAEKGYVYCDRSTRTNYYSAVILKETYQMNESTAFLDKLYDKSATKLIASLYQGGKLSKEEITNLREYLDSMDKGEH